jgi:flagellar basal body-associated protein FliL
MVDKGPKASAEEQPEGAAPSAPAAKAGFFSRIFTRKWLLVLLGMSVTLNAASFAYYRLRQRPEQAPPGELGLGNFHFEADKSEGGRIAKADFSLHVALLEPVDPLAKQRLATRKYHIQQDVEELLRKAHSGDFEDPGLQEMKRQLLEQINQTIGLRTVAEIIITDLRLRRSDQDGTAQARAKQSLPWDESPPERQAGPAAGKKAASASGGLADAEAR